MFANNCGLVWLVSDYFLFADKPGVISHLYGWTVRQQLFWVRRDQRQSRHSLTGRDRHP